MKTLEIKDVLKKDVLIVELPEDTQFDVFVDNPIWKDGIKFLTGPEEKFHFIRGNYTLLGRPDEIKEEDAKELVKQSLHTGLFAHYVKDIPVNTYCYKTATESLLSAIESEIFWENPEGKFPRYAFDENINPKDIKARAYHQKWHEAESRTFDKTRSLIFIKN